MYPVIRMAKELAVHAGAPPLGPFEEHVSRHLCWPWDVDVWLELNNGRTLTLFDLGRVVLLKRIGAVRALSRERWAGTVAGASVRYRSRVRMFDRLTIRSRVTGYDARFVYVEQSMWRGATCTSHALVRIAVTSRAGIVPTETVRAAMDLPPSPPLPPWIAAWADADALRPWPPMAEGEGPGSAG